MKRLWPIFAAFEVREWVEKHISGGVVEHVVVAGNAPLADFRAQRPADARGRPVGGDGDQRHDAAADRVAAADPRCRSYRSHHRPHRQCQRRARHRGGLDRGASSVSPVAYFECRIRIQSPRRRRRASASTARFRLRPNCWRATPCATAPGLRSIPSTSRGTVSAQVAVKHCVGKNVPKNSATYTDQRRSHQFCRRQAAARAEG